MYLSPQARLRKAMEEFAAKKGLKLPSGETDREGEKPERERRSTP